MSDGIKNRVATRNRYGLTLNRFDRLDTTLAEATQDTLERSLLDPDTIAHLKKKGVKTAAEAALWRMRDSLNPTDNAKFWNLVVSRMPKTVIHEHQHKSLSELPTGELLAALGLSAVEQAEVEGTLTDSDGGATKRDTA